MPFGVFILFVSIVIPLVVWIIKNEESVVEFEDEIFAKIKSCFSKNESKNDQESENKIYVVERKSERYDETRNKFSREERNFVA